MDKSFRYEKRGDHNVNTEEEENLTRSLQKNLLRHVLFCNAFGKWTNSGRRSIVNHQKKTDMNMRFGVCTIELFEVTLTLIPIFITNG